MRRRRPVLGTISGVVFGIFFALSLALWGLVPLDSVALTVVFVGGIVLGIAVGFTAPLGRLRSSTGKVSPEAAAAAVAGEAPAPATPPPPPGEPDAVGGQVAADEATSEEGTESTED